MAPFFISRGLTTMYRPVTLFVGTFTPSNVRSTGSVRSFISSFAIVTTSLRIAARVASSAEPSASYASARPNMTPWY